MYVRNTVLLYGKVCIKVKKNKTLGINALIFFTKYGRIEICKIFRR